MGQETQRVGDILLRFGMLDDEKMRRVVERQQQLRAEGKPARIGEVAVELGFLKPEQVKRVLAHEGTAILRCPKCDRRYTVQGYAANRRYKCGDCKLYLEFPMDNVLKATAIEPPAVEAAPPEPKKEEPQGPVIGKYRLIRPVGRGGMGTVHLGEHVETKKQFAVKILAEQFAKLPEIVKRFKREALTGEKLNHPNIVQIFDIDQEGKSFYIVSEFVDGQSLEKLLLSEKRLAPDRAIRIMKGVLAALQHAHDHGIVHRDIKPANVLLTKDETAKLIDFGIAKDIESQTVLTLAGSVLGSPSYMSPEQAQGEEVGPPTDLYACGVVLFVMLTGRKPYEGKNLVETLSMHVRMPIPSLREIVGEIPETVEKAVHKMMAKDPAKRHPSPSAAAAALDRALAGKSEVMRPSRPIPTAKPARAPVWIWITAGGGVLLVLALLLVLLLRS
jgi:serine/threonine protein kinase